jgi:hypothetical protein
MRQEDEEQAQGIQKVSGIIHYLERDLSRLRRENENKLGYTDLGRDNQRLHVFDEHTFYRQDKGTRLTT